MTFLLLMLLTPLLWSLEKVDLELGRDPNLLVPAAVSFLGASLLAAHLAAPESYSWQTDTISELAAQDYDKAWIMRTGFIGFGGF